MFNGFLISTLKFEKNKIFLSISKNLKNKKIKLLKNSLKKIKLFERFAQSTQRPPT